MIVVAATTAPQETSQCLSDIIPVLTPCMTDTKKEVKKAAKATMQAALNIVENTDIHGILPDIVNCIIKPKNTPELMHKLAGVVFVKTMDAPAMAVLVPLLVRGLREKTTKTTRQTAVIIDNMSKLVENPLDAAPFLALLLPALDKAADSVSDPEARAVCDRGLKQLQRLDKECKSVGDVNDIKVDPAAIETIIKTAIATEPDAIFSQSITFLTSICCSLVDGRCKATTYNNCKHQPNTTCAQSHANNH